jgi:MHS family citrate/tricarballylate:H+ symporter-like MFS transporter
VAKPTSGSKVKRAIQVSAGNFFEAFDLIVFGTFAKVIADNFFPAANEQLSLMLAFTTFASAYVMRFVGAIVLGPYFDHAGRRKGLLVSLTLMAIGTGMIAVAPTYQTVGVLGPAMIIVARLIQGFSIGSETGGVTAYLLEIAPEGRRGFFVRWHSTVINLATLLALLLGYLLTKYMAPADLTAWGWRVPPLIGCGIIPLIFFLRRGLVETEVFEQQAHHPSMKEVLESVISYWRVALAGMFMIVVSSSTFYFMFTFMPVFVKEQLGLTAEQSLLSTVIAITYSLFLLPAFALLSDRIGRFRILATTAALVVLTAYPSLRWLVDHPTYGTLIVNQLWFGTLYAAYASSSFVALSELVPARIRATGYGVSTALGLAIFGGFTPLISTWLIHLTGDGAAPGWWLMFVAALGFVACFVLFRLKSFIPEVSVGSHSYPGPRGGHSA